MEGAEIRGKKPRKQEKPMKQEKERIRRQGRETHEDDR